MTPVANTADKYYLGTSLVDRIACGAVQVWPPKLLVSDNFNRPDQAGLGSSWRRWTTAQSAPFTNQFNIVGNAAKSDGPTGGANSLSTWLTDSFVTKPDQFSQCRIAIMPGSALWHGVVVRGNFANGNHYLAIAFNNGGTPEIDLYKMLSGSWSLVAGGGGSFAAGDIFRIEAQGTTIRVKINGTTRISTTDSSITGGQPGIAAAGTITLDDFQAGEL